MFHFDISTGYCYRLNALLVLLLFIGFSQQMIAQQTYRADDLVNSIGVNTHWGYDDTPYYQEYDTVRTLLGELGIRFIRDRIDELDWRRNMDWYDRYGVRLLGAVGLNDYSTGGIDVDALPAFLDAVRSRYGTERLIGILGENEWDLSTDNLGNRKPTAVWTAEWWAAQQAIYDSVKADPVLRQLPVVAGPLAHDNQLKYLGNISAVADIGTDHPYPGHNGLPYQVDGGRNIQDVVDEVQQAMDNDRPIWFTETGYERPASGGGDPNRIYYISPAARAKYYPRLLANHFRNPGIEKTFIYELLSFRPDNPWGLINYDFSKDDAFYSIRNLIQLCGEARWDIATLKWVEPPAYKPIPLAYDLLGDLDDIERLLLQKSDGTYLLLLWQEVRSFDNETLRDIAVAPRNLELVFKGGVAAQVNEYRLYDPERPAADLAPRSTSKTSVDRITVAVPDDIVALEITLDDAPPTVLDGTYQLVARHSGKALSLDLNPATNGGKQDPTQDGTNVFQYGTSQTAERLWQLQLAEPGYYTLTNQYSGKTLDVDLNPVTNGGYQEARNNGTNVFQYGTQAQSNRLWKLIPTEAGYYRLVSKYSGKVLDVSYISKEDGANVHQWEYVGGYNQQWKLVPVSSSARVDSPVLSSKSSSSTTEVVVYPNPATSQLTVSWLPTSYEVSIFNHLGQRTWHQTNLQGETQLDVSAFPTGVYTVQLSDGGQQRVLHRVVIQ